MSDRTPTPQIDQIWTRHATLSRWHRLWLLHLELQMSINPGHPGNRIIAGTDALGAYRATVATLDDKSYLQRMWQRRIDQKEAETRHDLYAALLVLNERTGRDEAHLGLASADI